MENINKYEFYTLLVKNEEVASAVCLKQCLPPNTSMTYEFGLFIDMPKIKFPKSNTEYFR